jgi:hypothetical protein
MHDPRVERGATSGTFCEIGVGDGSPATSSCRCLFGELDDGSAKARSTLKARARLERGAVCSDVDGNI